VSNHVVLALKSDPSPIFIKKCFFHCSQYVSSLAGFLLAGPFRYSFQISCIDIGWDLKGAQKINPATSPELPPLCAPCYCATQTGRAAYVTILQMFKFMSEKLRVNKIQFTTFFLVLYLSELTLSVMTSWQ
jgi:hypothetical protein